MGRPAGQFSEPRPMMCSESKKETLRMRRDYLVRWRIKLMLSPLRSLVQAGAYQRTLQHVRDGVTQLTSQCP